LTLKAIIIPTMLFDFTDILFENRNKLYGAYQLRKQYHKALWIGLIANIPIFIALVLWIRWEAPKEMEKSQYEERIIVLQVNDVQISDIKDMPVFMDQNASQTPHISTKNTEDSKKEENQEKQDTQKEIEIKENKEEKPEEKKTDEKKQEEKKGENSTSENTTPVLYSKDVWSIYIKKNLRYPEQALKEGKECKVTVTVLIQEDGSIKIEKDRPLYGCEDYFNAEVKRLIKEAPRFVPAINEEGQPQRKISLSIHFNLPK